MESSGGGVTFTGHDLANMKMLIGLLNKAKFNDLNVVQTIQAANALQFGQDLLKIMEENVLEIRAISKNQAVQQGSDAEAVAAEG